MKRISIKDMQKLAEIRNGQCLSGKYVNTRTKLKWQCEKGHEWSATPDSVKRGSWCPRCGRLEAGKKLSLNLEEMNDLAKKYNGKCLSNKYFNASTKLMWECQQGHKWEAIPSSIKKGHWCPICRHKDAGKKKRLTIDEMHLIAKKRGGKCLSKEYTVGKKLKWECKYGHQWEATPRKIKYGTWCPICGNIEGTKKRSLTLEEMQAIALNRGGKCLSKQYVNTQTNLLWQCKYGHRWKARPSLIKDGSWCPECTSGFGEKVCKVFFETLFKKKFSKQYPKWLVNDDGNRMELDGYCDSLKLAFEHQGKHHYSTKHFFIGTQEDLRKRKRDDKRKKELCENKGILLIQIPEVPSKVPIDRIKSIIRRKCELNNLKLPKNFDSTEVNLEKVYNSYRSSELLKEFDKTAANRNGKCLSTKYVNALTKLSWECNQGHRWKALPHNILKGHWCPKCSGRARLTIQEMNAIAIERKGKCLSDNYINSSTKLNWECEYGHQWQASPSCIKSGQWCPVCGRKQSAKKRSLTIDEMHKIANEFGGRCLSDEYINCDTKLLWKCANGHKWWAIPYTIKKGHWCPACAGNIESNIEEMQRIAKDRDGKCLSKRYKNTHSKLKWKCKYGHQWEAVPSSIKKGHWCPICAKNRKRIY